MTPEDKIAAIIDLLISDVPCCACCEGDESYRERVIEIGQIAGVAIEEYQEPYETEHGTRYKKATLRIKS
jgi:hypothetical protein